MDEEVLVGGVANAGAVTRRGDVTLRPATPFTASAHDFLRAVRARGFDGVAAPIGVGDDGREALGFIDGDVAIPPYPEWVQADEALGSVARLMRALHDAAADVGTAGRWSTEMADPDGGPIICHNDVCLENVVFRAGHAVALLDWDFAAPGRPAYDLAQMARMCVPIDDDDNAGRLGWLPADRPLRLRLVCDHYGMNSDGRAEVLAELDRAIHVGGEFVLRRVEAGEPNFIAMWDAMGGMRRYDRRREWWAEQRRTYADALQVA